MDLGRKQGHSLNLKGIRFLSCAQRQHCPRSGRSWPRFRNAAEKQLYIDSCKSMPWMTYREILKGNMKTGPYYFKYKCGAFEWTLRY